MVTQRRWVLCCRKFRKRKLLILFKQCLFKRILSVLLQRLQRISVLLQRVLLSKQQPYLIKDFDGSMIDARPLLAAINKNILNKCSSKNRVDKVKSVLKGKDNECCDNDREVDQDNDTQSLTLGSFGWRIYL